MKSSLKRKFKFFSFVFVALILLVPSAAFAAGDPLQSKADSFITDVISLILSLLAGAATLSFLYFAFKSFLSTDAHKKAQDREGMISTIKIFAIALCAKLIVAWIQSKLG